jgi:hypothetical protein
LRKLSRPANLAAFRAAAHVVLVDLDFVSAPVPARCNFAVDVPAQVIGRMAKPLAEQYSRDNADAVY